MDKQKFNLILDKLLEKTEKGMLEWETTANRKTFLVVLEDSSISVSHSFERDSDFDDIIIGDGGIYTFDFRNENGEIVESVEVSQIYKNNEAAVEFEKAEQVFQFSPQAIFAGR